jgi:hypothetical protein
MSEDLVEEPFRSAAKRVSDAYDQAAEELKDRVGKSKADALKKIIQ